MGARLTKTVHAQKAGAQSVVAPLSEHPQLGSTKCDLASAPSPPSDAEPLLQVDPSLEAESTMDPNVESPADPSPQATDTAMEDAIIDGEAHTESAVQNPPTPAPPSGPTCVTCCEECSYERDSPRLAIRPCPSCPTVFCSSCIKEMFIRACRDVSLMPPRCCVALPLHKALPFLSQEEADEFRAKQAELATPNPLYCPVARCSTFIPTRLLSPAARAQLKGKAKRGVDSGTGTPNIPNATCPKCEVDICTNCRALAHPGTSCTPLDFGVGMDEATAEVIRGWGYKKCPRCGNGVKRMFGCKHMQCLCGVHFCWSCLDTTQECGYECTDDEGEDEDEDDDDISQYNPIDTPPRTRRSSVAADAQPAENQPLLAEEDWSAWLAPPADGQTSQPVEDPTSQPAENQPTPPEDDWANFLTPPMEDVSTLSEDQTSPPAEPQTSQPAEEPQPTQPTSPQPSRPINLDRGSSSHWADLGLDFGDEPSDDYDTRFWDCMHTYGDDSSIPVLKLSPQEAFREAFDPAATEAPHMECMMCNRGIRPEMDVSALKADADAEDGSGVHALPRARSLENLKLDNDKDDDCMEDVQYSASQPSTFVAADFDFGLKARQGCEDGLPLAYQCESCGLLVCGECRVEALREGESDDDNEEEEKVGEKEEEGKEEGDVGEDMGREEEVDVGKEKGKVEEQGREEVMEDVHWFD